MNLPGPDSGIKWKDYQNNTPTFQLTSIEKPDSSPFLIHMTGRNELISILKGENSPEDKEVPDKYGYLKSSIPDYSAGFYNSSVVCFTESPLFSLDFFRYRSFSRWRADQQFGIGFSKKSLVDKRNVRPVIYLDSQTNKDVLTLSHKILDDSYTVTDDQGEIQDLKPLFEKLKPLLFPMLEDKQSEGFMWEREWRCPDDTGMTFPLNAIRVICCPANEREEIEELLVDHLDKIQIVESWKEYDDVTTFLKRREKTKDYDSKEKLDKIGDIDTLKELKQQNDQTLNTLSAYYKIFKGTVEQLEHKSIGDILTDLKKTSSMINDRIKEIEAEKKEKEKQAINK